MVLRDLMEPKNMLDYRARIYGQYVSARDQSLAPRSIEGLKPRRALFTKLIRDHFPADRAAKILDLGCGHGTLLYFALQAGYENVLGVDVSAEQVAAAQYLGIKGVQQGDLMQVLRMLPNESQDVVVAFDILEHFTRDEMLPFVDEVQRVVKMGGRWIIHTPNGESPFHGKVFYGDFTHEHAFTRTSINQLLLSSGFSQVACFEDVPIAHGLKSGSRRLVWKGIRSLLRLYIAAETGQSGNDGIFSQSFLTVAVR